MDEVFYKRTKRDLMVGDWLQYNDVPYRVTQVSSTDAGQTDYSYKLENGEENCGEPILLTPEILEKNGFFCYNKETESYRWEYIEGVFINADFKSEEPYVSIHNRSYWATPHLYFVHQFQHALRLCGIYLDVIM